uniref:alpha-protein kinase 3 isoform X1 n=1 Tax=Solea senegalensis TaxID=28829 RepID=UPI001CD90C78|nr:alpha-protein kinase 3 isoform X1 [Solea senegalensis]
MTSRRPMIRSYSEGSSSNGRTERSNSYLSNVRPENSYSRYSHYRPTRSTLCSVMAQLTEDVQPSFETTLKSKAVSETCNVKFTCVVSGYPAPELKWYKDDTEMDRYCGLPKYEIHRNGKTHTLHIYNCTLDDAAIYQVSASNSKGIVSCSGVLEVGTMNEFQIHQRFFSKLKQKAEKKKKELEGQTKMKDKENIQKDKPQTSPERPPRKRHIPPPQDTQVVKKPDVGEQLGAAAEPNGVAMEVASVTSIDSGLEKETPVSTDSLATKKIKISNGVDDGVNGSSSKGSSRTNMMGIGGENGYDGGMGLAQFLAETLQTQAAEEKQNLPPLEKHLNNTKETETEEQVQALVEEHERKKSREEDFAKESENEQERPVEVLHTTAHGKRGSEGKHHSKAHKDHEHHNIQSSLTSVLHTVKDFFFGKSKKDFHDHKDIKGREFDHDSVQPLQPEMPPSFQLQSQYTTDVHRSLSEDIVPMETDEPKVPLDSEELAQQPVSSETHNHKHEDSFPLTDLPAAHKKPPEHAEESTGQKVKEADDPVQAMDVCVGAGSSSPGEDLSLSKLQVLTEIKDKDSQVASVTKEDAVKQQEPDALVVSPQGLGLPRRDESSPMEVLSQIKDLRGEERPPTPTITILEESWIPPQSLISVSDSQHLGQAQTEKPQEEQLNKTDEEGKPAPEKGRSSTELREEEKAEVKSSERPLLCVNRSEITELATSSLEERIEPCEYKALDQVLSPPLAVAEHAAESSGAKEEAECTSLIQEIHVGFPPTAEGLESVDLKTQHESGEERAQGRNLSAEQSSSSDSVSEDARNDLNLASERSLEVSVKAQEHIVLAGEKSEERNEHLKFETEREKREEVESGVEMLDDSKTPVSQSQEKNVLEEQSETAHGDGGERRPSENIPQVHISIIEDSPDIALAVPVNVKHNEHFVIPKIEIMQPEFKESDNVESELAIFQDHDVTHMSEKMIKGKNMTDSPGLPPTERDKQQDGNLSPTEKDVEVAQLTNEVAMKSGKRLPQTNHTSVPVINVSCTDDNDEVVNAHVPRALQPLETQTVPLFVVPPISVTCHESDPGLKLPTQSQWTETETSAVTQTGTKHDADNNVTTKTEKSRQQDTEEVAERSRKEITPSLVCETLIPKATDNVLSFSKTTEDSILPEIMKTKSLKETKTEMFVSIEDLQRNRCPVDRLSSKPPAHPSLSPASLRRFMSKTAPDTDIDTATSVSDKIDEDLSGGSTPTSLSCENSPRLKRRDSLTLIRSATPEELASGARRKIFIPKPKEDGDGVVSGVLDAGGKKESPYMSPSQSRRASLLQAPKGQNTPPMERRSPLMNRRKATLEVPRVVDDTPKEEAVCKREEKPAEKKPDPLRAPQVIRKIRGEPFPDASGHLKLWCQFFNVLSDSTIKWYRDEEEILEIKRSGGDESQIALAIVLASSKDCGVYGCTINNEYGTDTTDFLLSEDILSEILLREDLEVGEEIEMTPLLFPKGLVDSGTWGEKYFGRIMTETVHVGKGCAHKASRVKVIYGLDPVFDSGSSCIIKVQNPIAYGTKPESSLVERSQEITKQECKVQNMIREYCKIFAAEARVNENFGFSLEVIPRYLMYRPANSVPYATVEVALEGVFLQYCMMDPKGTLITQTVSEVEQKCSTFQHWIHQWTHGNLFVTRLEGVENKLTNIGVVTKSKGYQGLTEIGSPEVFEQFQTQHQCNYYCGLLGLRPLKSMDSQPSKIKGSRSPLLNRKIGSSSPQMHRKDKSPQLSRKANSSPKVARKVLETADTKPDAKLQPSETVDALQTS